MIKREKQEKEESIPQSIINELVNIALASSKIKKISIEQENGVHSLRSNINLFIFGQIGSTKSTLLNQIAKDTNSIKPFTDLTYPALVGSVENNTKQLIIGSCWECRNSLMLLDEFDFGKRKKDDIRALLQLIEGGSYSRKLASFSMPHKEEDGDLYYTFNNGLFSIQTRFSLIVVTMKYPYTSQSPEVKALVTRSICIPWYPEKDELIKISNGFPLFKFEDKTPKNLEPVIILKDYNYIQKIVFENIRSNNILRVLGDCCRVFAVEGRHREDLYKLIIKLGSKKFQSKTPSKNGQKRD